MTSGNLINFQIILRADLSLLGNLMIASVTAMRSWKARVKIDMEICQAVFLYNAYKKNEIFVSYLQNISSGKIVFELHLNACKIDLGR